MNSKLINVEVFFIKTSYDADDITYGQFINLTELDLTNIRRHLLSHKYKKNIYSVKEYTYNNFKKYIFSDKTEYKQLLTNFHLIIDDQSKNNTELSDVVKIQPAIFVTFNTITNIEVTQFPNLYKYDSIDEFDIEEYCYCSNVTTGFNYVDNFDMAKKNLRVLILFNKLKNYYQIKICYDTIINNDNYDINLNKEDTCIKTYLLQQLQQLLIYHK